MKQEIRIIGGRYRGKKLSFPDIDDLRPTSNRIRETLFNWLMHDIRGARCLDAFAGSGALGFEAFSRGASHVVLLEYSLQAHANLNKMLSYFNSPTLKLARVDALHYLKNSKEQFDIIFLDPPFAHNYWMQCIASIEHNNLLVPGGLLYVESSIALEMNEHIWLQLKQKQAGHVIYTLFERYKK